MYLIMGKRREARERAVQFLFQHDLNPPEKLDEALEHFWSSQRTAAIAEDKGVARWGQTSELPAPTAEEAEVRLFADPLIRGTLEHRNEALGRIGRTHDAFERVTAHAFDQRPFLLRRSGHAHEPFGIGELRGKVAGALQLNGDLDRRAA